MGLRLKQVRERKGVSLRVLAAESGISFTTIHRIEKGEETPRFSTLEKLAKALGVSVRDLIEK